MGSKYKEKFERKWANKSLVDVKLKTLQIQADRNLTKVVKGKLSVQKRRLRNYGMQK